ncbi:MAG: DUF389 domain-containing protein [Acidimicrobiales bacterium]
MEHPESLTADAELEDLDEPAGFDLAKIDRALLSSPVVVRALVGIAIALPVLVWPGRTDGILARLIGLGAVWVASASLWAELRSRPRHIVTVLAGIAGLGIGGALIAFPDQSEVVVARLVGYTIAIVALRDLARVRNDSGAGPRSWIVSRAVALLAAAAILVVFPSQVFAIATTAAALGWITLSVAVIAISLDARTTGVADYAASTRLIGDWLAERSKSVDHRQALYDKILYEGSLTAHRIIRFFTLMGFASVIAAMGVVTDSTAVVIGAMLIAPLMTPLMGMAISLVMGWPNRLKRSALVASAGIGFAISIGALIGLSVPAVIDTTTNSQILSRSSPTILDLIIALAAGAAGAYGLSRPDVSDSLPGVAIAISLVPPLSVVGIAYSQGDWMAGNGALLLFTTNMLAILIMGGLTFVLTGVAPLRRAAQNQHRVRTSIGAIATLAALVVGALLLNGAQIAEDIFEQSSTEDAINEWLDDYPKHSLIRVNLDGDTVTATILGPAAGAPTAQSLATQLQKDLGGVVTADLRLIVEERDTATSDS